MKYLYMKSILKSTVKPKVELYSINFSKIRDTFTKGKSDPCSKKAPVSNKELYNWADF